jgi:hypothetical protein
MVGANDPQPNRKKLNRLKTAVVGMMLTGGFLFCFCPDWK